MQYFHFLLIFSDILAGSVGILNNYNLCHIKTIEWKNEIIKSSANIASLSEANGDLSAPDILDQASSQTEKTVEMRTLNRQIKLLTKIDQAIDRIKNDTFGYCEETGEPIGVKRLVARPIATLSIEAQEKHERNEKIFASV